MPNFWSKIAQEAYECFNGPRTKDYDFDKKAQELQLAKDKIFQLRAIIANFPQRTLPFKSMLEEISSLFSLVFDRNTNYYRLMDDVCNAHRALLNAYSECCDKMKKVYDECSDWDNKFIEVENDIKRRNDLRKNYDHYDEKMEKLVKERTARFNKGKTESESDIQKFESNEKKYKDAALEYVQLSNQTFFKMQTLLDLRYAMVAPVVGDFLEAERLFFVQGAQIMDYFNGVSPKIKRLENGFKKTPITYDAAESLRGRNILNKENDKEGYLLTGIIPGNNNGQNRTPLITGETNNTGNMRNNNNNSNINNNINNNNNNNNNRGGGGYGQMGNQMNPYKQQQNNYGGIAQNPYGFNRNMSMNVNVNMNPYSGNPYNNPYANNNNPNNPMQKSFNTSINKSSTVDYNQQKNVNQNNFARNNSINNPNPNNNNNLDNPFASDIKNNNDVPPSNPYDLGNTNPYDNNEQNPYEKKPNDNNNNDNYFPLPPSNKL